MWATRSTGESRLLVGARTRNEGGAVTSPDGTQIVFAREVPGTTTGRCLGGRDGRDGPPQDHARAARHADLGCVHARRPPGRAHPPGHGSRRPGARRRSVAWPGSTWSTHPGSGTAKTIATADGMDFVLFRPPDGQRTPVSRSRRWEVGPVRDGPRRRQPATGRPADRAVRDGHDASRAPPTRPMGPGSSSACTPTMRASAIPDAASSSS